jgi:predicted metal-binding membrane protein
MFCASVVATIYLRGAMLDGMGMDSGTGMLGQVWLGAAVLFLAMWVVMMVAMMVPSLAPALVSYRRTAGMARAQRLGWLAALAGAGYFCVCAAVGVAAYALVSGLAALGHRIPSAAVWGPRGGRGSAAGGRLSAYAVESASAPVLPRGTSQGASGDLRSTWAWQWGLRLGAHCGAGCAGYVAILLASGMTDLGVMALVAAGITIEHLAPRPALVTHAAGGVLLVAGAILMVRALGVA